jgi:hypothetical protein
MKTNINKFITGVAMAATLVYSISSCKKDDGDNKQLTASLSFVNSAEGSSAQDVYVNDSKINTSAVAYGSASTNNSTSAGNKTVAFKNTGSASATASANVSADVNTSKTLFLVKQSDGSLAISAYSNENTATSGNARSRFINVAPLLSNTINVTTSTGASVISALSFKAASAYQTVDAATTFNVSMSGSLEVTTISGSEFQAGKIYTVWFDSSSTTKAKYHVVVEN